MVELWPVYKGESFDLWQPDTGTYYAAADPSTNHQVLAGQAGSPTATGAIGVLVRSTPSGRHDPPHCRCHCPRVAFRDMTRRPTPGPCQVALLPPSIVIANQGAYLLWSSGRPA